MNIKFTYRDYTLTKIKYINQGNKRRLINHVEMVEFDIGSGKIYVVFTTWTVTADEYKSFPLLAIKGKRRTGAGFLRSLLKCFPSYSSTLSEISSYVNFSSSRNATPFPESFIKFICKDGNPILKYQEEREIDLGKEEIDDILDKLLATHKTVDFLYIAEFYFYDAFAQFFFLLSAPSDIEKIIQELKDGKEELSINEGRYTF